MAIVNQRLTTTQLNILTVPPGKSYAITNVLVCNTNFSNSGLDASFDMHLIPNNGGNPGTLSNAKTLVVKELNLPVGETFTFDSERIVLEAGDMLSFVAEPDVGSDNTNLAATVSYLEV